jgi:acid stress chaperone HdeB
MTLRRAAFVACALVLAAPAYADRFDFSTLKCKEFLAKDKEEVGVILAWLDGYYKNENDPPIFDTDKFLANAKKLGEYCGAHPDDGLITATDQLFGK